MARVPVEDNVAAILRATATATSTASVSIRVSIPAKRAAMPLMVMPISSSASTSLEFISLVGVKDTTDNITPIPQEVLDRADGKLEVIDRSGEFYGQPMRQNVKLLHKEFDPYEAGVGDFDGSSNIDSNATLFKQLG